MRAGLLVTGLAGLLAAAILSVAPAAAAGPSAFYVAKRCTGNDVAQRLLRTAGPRTTVIRPCQSYTDSFFAAESSNGRIVVAALGTDPSFSLARCSAAGKCRPLELRFPTAGISALALSPNGSRIVFASWESLDGMRTRVWEVSAATGTAIRRSVRVPTGWAVAGIAPSGRTFIFRRATASTSQGTLYAGTILGKKRPIGNARTTHARVLAFDGHDVLVSNGTSRCESISIETRTSSRVACPRGAVAARLGGA